MNDLSIFEADLTNPLHQQAVLDLVNEYARDPMGDGQDLPSDVLENLIPALRKHPTTLIFLAFLDQTPVGIAVCFIGFSTFQARPLINIHDLAVVPTCRGRRVGRLLLEAVEAKARSLQCGKITLEVREDNPAARLYRSVGFGDLELEHGSVPMRFLAKKL